MSDNKPIYIDGVGWRCEKKLSHKRRMRNHQYNEVGTYMVTIVVEGREPVFGHIKGNTRAHHDDGDYPATVLSPLGERVLREELPKIHEHYPMVEVWRICIMPDHIHLIIRINATMPPKKSLGNVIGGFKGGISRAWGGGRPLFEDNYNDRVLMRNGQLNDWKMYLHANPFRWLMMRENPDIMQRALCLEINGVRYGAFGNFMLLRHPEKVQVFFHRKMQNDRLTPAAQGPTQQQGTISQRGTLVAQQQSTTWQRGTLVMVPTETTIFWERERERLLEIAEQGDVLVTPGISECEKRMKNDCLRNGYRLIHLQAEPIGRYWKPERSRFDACCNGSLLVLAPWQEDLQGYSDYERFHNLNALAKSICTLGANASFVIKNTTNG